MLFLVNNGPFAGEEGRVIMLRQIRERLDREMRTNVALRVEDVGRGDGVKVSGRGEFHLAILIEEMRREGLELCVSRPEVITHTDAQGRLLEPIEQLIIDVPGDFQGVVIEKLARRKGELRAHGKPRHRPDAAGVRDTHARPDRLSQRIPHRHARARHHVQRASSATAPGAGRSAARNRGSLVSMETGPATPTSSRTCRSAPRCSSSRPSASTPARSSARTAAPTTCPATPPSSKRLTNHRAAAKDQTVTLDAPRKMTLDQALEWIAADELVEVTPRSIRVRKAVLSADERKRARRRELALRG